MTHNSTLATQKSKKFNPVLWGTIGYLFLFIFRPFEYWEWLGKSHIERIYMIVLIIIVMFLSGKRYKHHSIATALIALFGVICLSAMTTYWPNKALYSDFALNQVWEYFKLMVLFFVILLTVRDERDFRILIIAFVAITGIYVGKSLWEFLIYGRRIYRMGIFRLGGIDQTFNDPNTFAATIVYSLPFAWVLWKTSPSSRIKMGLIFYSIMSIVAIALTGSRSGMLSFIFFLLLLWVRGKKKVLGFVVIVLVLVIGWLNLPEKYQERFETIYDDSINRQATQSAKSRISQFNTGMKLFELSPILGWGPGCSRFEAYKLRGYNYKEEDETSEGVIQLHNLYAQLLSELGIMGAASFLSLIFLIILTQRKITNNLGKTYPGNHLIINTAIACTSTMWLLLFEGIFGHNLYRYNWIWISTILVLAYQFSMEHAKKEI